MKINMTYQDYLNNWDNTFSSDDDQEYWYWDRGQQVPYTAEKLTEEQFSEHLQSLNSAVLEFDGALKSEDDDGMGLALARSFPHELALLI